MTKQGFGIALILCMIGSGLFANENIYKADELTKNLTDNAKAVVRKDEVVFRVISIGKAIMSVKHAVTVLDKNGDSYASFIAYYDKLKTISNLKIRLYNKLGELIKKVKNSDIMDYSAVSGYSLFEENRVKYYKPLVNTYPYTIEYEYELNYNGLLHYPTWQPISAYDQSVEQSSYTVLLPDGIDFRYKESNVTEGVKMYEEDGKKAYSWSVENIKAKEKESYSPYLYEFTPVVYAAPTEFEIEGYAGNMSNWKLFGQWLNMLNDGMAELPMETKIKLRSLVKNDTTQIDKIKKVYSYLQNKTRYISVQIGIGGWRPYEASIVDELGYGDCKALTNYMLAMLKVIGIKSYYTLVKAGDNQRIHADFPSNQFNHAILCVPLKKDTVWLECTSQSNPFGYLGSFTNDRDVLLVTENGGQIAHTDIYYQHENIQFRKAEVALDQEGNGIATIKTSYAGLQYDNIKTLFNIERVDQKKLLDKSINLPHFKLQDFHISHVKKRIPSSKLLLELDLTKYASMSGKRLFIPLNLLNKVNSIPGELEQRSTNIALTYAFHDADTIAYAIPENFKVEYKPEDVSVKTVFGEYHTTVSVNKHEIVYTRNRKMNKGVFPPESYDELISFYKKMVKADRMKLVLVKDTK